MDVPRLPWLRRWGWPPVSKMALLGLALLAGGCSAELPRLDKPSFGLSAEPAGAKSGMEGPLGAASNLSGSDAPRLAVANSGRGAGGSKKPPVAMAMPRVAGSMETAPHGKARSREAIEVKPGDTLFSLARRYRVSLAALKAANNLRSPVLHPGQKLVLPREAGRAATPPASSSRGRLPAPPAGWTSTYKLQAGDSLYRVALNHNVKLEELQRVNGIADVRRVPPGTILRVPVRRRAGAQAGMNGLNPPSQMASVPLPQQPKPATPEKTEKDVEGSPAGVRAGKSALLPPVSHKKAETPPAATSPPPAPGGAEAAGGLAEPTPTAVEDRAGDKKTDRKRSEEKAESPQKNPAAQPSISPASGGRLVWPVTGRIVTPFGKRPDGTQSDGIDIAVPAGTEVRAADGGVVAYAGSELPGYGNLILLRHDNGWVTAYAHNSVLLVARGDKVARGQVIARSGKTGNIREPQLHFEVRQESKPVDPAPLLGAL